MGAVHSVETKTRKAALAIVEITGRDFEEVFSELKAKLPVESPDDKIAEAEAVVQYFETRGEHFNHVNCRECGELFAYKWDRHAIAFCGIPCANANLKRRGLSWNPTRGPGQRWGRTAPIVVSAEALHHVKSLLEQENGQTDQIEDTPQKESL